MGGSAADFGGVHDFALLFQFFDVLVKAEFRDGADGRGAHFEREPFARFRHEEFFGLQVGVKTPTCLAVGVRDVVAGYRPLARQFTYF